MMSFCPLCAIEKSAEHSVQKATACPSRLVDFLTKSNSLLYSDLYFCIHFLFLLLETTDLTRVRHVDEFTLQHYSSRGKFCKVGDLHALNK